LRLYSYCWAATDGNPFFIREIASPLLGQECDLNVLSAVPDQPDDISLIQATEALRAR
jgi:hypothetical protein